MKFKLHPLFLVHSICLKNAPPPLEAFPGTPPFAIMGWPPPPTELDPATTHLRRIMIFFSTLNIETLSYQNNTSVCILILVSPASLLPDWFGLNTHLDKLKLVGETGTRI